MGSPLQAIMSLLQAPQPRQPVTVRPDYGLTGADIQAMQKSPYERTLRPGETRSPDELRDMLAEVILAAGAAAVPGVGPKGQARRAPGQGAPPKPTVNFLDLIMEAPTKAPQPVMSPKQTQRLNQIESEIQTQLQRRNEWAAKTYRNGPEIELGRRDEYGGTMSARRINEARRRNVLAAIDEEVARLKSEADSLRGMVK